MDRKTAQEVHKEVDSAMMEIAAKYKLVWVGQRFVFSETELKSKLRFKTKDSVKDQLEQMGLQYGRPYKGRDGRWYTALGTTKGKVIAECEGQQYRCTPGYLGGKTPGKLTLGKAPWEGK